MSERRRTAHGDSGAAGGEKRGGDTGRRRAREVAFRVAYESDVNGDGYAEVWARVGAEEILTGDQRELVDDLIRSLAASGADVDRHIEEAIERWPLARLSATDRAVLRAAVAELVARPGSPVPVILDEAIEIARRFGSDESGRFVNGVLDRVARQLRSGEV
jgi:transcription antitermination protein NusB